jgi:DNA-directed RNA polymerase specialized sigma24 family protein
VIFFLRFIVERVSPGYNFGDSLLRRCGSKLTSQEVSVDRPPPPSGDYWYLGSQDGAVDALFRRVCALAWPYALLCATRYLHDVQAAYDLMDAAVSNAEEYYERFNGNRTFSQIFYRVLSVLKRSSKRRALNSREVPSGSLPDLERKAHALTSKPEAEQTAYVRQLLAQMTVRSRKIAIWRTEGHTWRQIAGKLKVHHAALRRAYYRELRRLFSPASGGASSLEGEG